MATNVDGGYEKVNNFNAVKISLADPKKIREQSNGEVKKAETINYRSYKPEKEGLFCEKIFGPERDYECTCGKYRGQKYKDMTCERCGVKIVPSRVRRHRMGHIELAAPVVHIWFFKAATSRLATLLAMKASALEKVVYFQEYVVIDPGDAPVKKGELLDENKFKDLEIGGYTFRAEMGAEAIRALLQNLNVVTLAQELREELKDCKSKQRRKEIISRLKLVEALKNCREENKPEWMVLDVIPVIPPDLRPLVLLDSGTFATSDLNDLYRRIINRNSRLRKLLDLNAPDVIVRNEKRMLQQSVDALFDNGRNKRPIVGPSNRPLKSLTDMIKGKQGRFRENLLGKRVDYSARSVIVVGPHLHLHQCGLPKPIALELYQPFIIRRLKESGHADTIKSAKKMIERRDDEVWDILERVIQNHPVLLNRAPTLHRMGIQAFEPLLVEGNAINLHPLVCKGFNADFDGDQMAVHLPLSFEAQVEAHTLMLSTNNIFSPANGKPIMSPSQDIVMGCYYITMDMPGMPGEGMVFSSIDECLLAHSLGKVDLHAKIKVRMPAGRTLKNDPSITGGKLFETTPGRIIFNQILADGSPYYNIPQDSKQLSIVISDCHELLGRRATIDLLDRIMRLGFEQSTKSGLSFATDDLITPPAKKAIIAKAEKEVQDLREQANEGFVGADERYSKVLDIWSKVRDDVTAEMQKTFENDSYKTEAEAKKAGDVKRRKKGYVNPVYLMAHSGARGGMEQIRQLAGLRGLMARPNGTLIETPVKANFLEGLSVLEYFSSTHGARKGLSDTALKTADSGYLTRKLASVSQNCVVTREDCGTTRGVFKSAIEEGGVKIPLSQQIVGRVLCDDVTNLVTDEEIGKKGQLVTPEMARKIDSLPTVNRIKVRSPMTCDAEQGVCSKCYGMDLSTGRLVEVGMAVGVIAAQSIGEPGTQLTMRTFHIGGVGQHNAEDSEIRTKYAGIVRFLKMEAVENIDAKGVTTRIVLSCKPDGGVNVCNTRGMSRDVYPLPEGATLLVKEGDVVEAGETIATIDPHMKPILARSAGVVRYDDLVEGETYSRIKDESAGQTSLTVLDFKGDRHPTLKIAAHTGSKVTETYQLPSRSTINVADGETVKPGTILARIPQDASGTQDITSGLPRVTEIFEARRPSDPAVMAQIDGEVEILEKRSHGKQIVVIRQEIRDKDGKSDVQEVFHEIPQNKRVRVFTGDVVKKGQPITDGRLVPHDILAVQGVEAVQEHLVKEVQSLYRSQNVSINDKHIEIIVSQMLRKIRIDDGGDTDLLVGDEVDKFEFNRRNRELDSCVKVMEPGDTKFQTGEVVALEDFNLENDRVNGVGGAVASYQKPNKAKGKPRLLGITKAAVQSDSFLAAASFQETTKVLTEAALASKVDRLYGLNENVILGRLIPAGTGFRSYQNASFKHCGVEESIAAAGQAFVSTDQTLLNEIVEPKGAEAFQQDLHNAFLSVANESSDGAYSDANVTFDNSFEQAVYDNDYDPDSSKSDDIGYDDDNSDDGDGFAFDGDE